MKKNLVIALGIGALISAVLIAIEPFTDYAFLSLEWPGITAALFFSGAIGGGALVGVVIAWAVNTLSYGLLALGILTAFTGLINPKTR